MAPVYSAWVSSPPPTHKPLWTGLQTSSQWLGGFGESPVSQSVSQKDIGRLTTVSEPPGAVSSGPFHLTGRKEEVDIGYRQRQKVNTVINQEQTSFVVSSYGSSVE